MAVGTPTLFSAYGFPEALISNPALPGQLNDLSSSCLVSLGAPSFTGQSLFSLYGAADSTGCISSSNGLTPSSSWDLYGASFAPTFFDNLPNPSSIQSVADSDDFSYDPSNVHVDSLLLGNDSEFLQQIDAGSTSTTACGSSGGIIIAAAATPVMHPNLVSTLKNMVTPTGSLGSESPSSFNPRSSSTRYYNSSSELLPFDQQSDFQIGASAFLRGLHSRNPVDSTRNILLRSFPDFDEMCTRASLLSTADRADGQITASHQTVAVKQEDVVLLDAESNLQTLDQTTADQEEAVLDPIEEAAVVSVDLIQNRRPFLCTHAGCSKTFKNPQTMKMHNKTHCNADSGSTASRAAAGHTTTVAPSTTLTSSSLKAGHNKKIPSRCPKCKKTFVGLYELRRHYGRKHSEGEKPFGCRNCGKKFYIEVDVRDHEKLCGEPIECKCGLKFAFKCNLVAHKKAHPACQDTNVMTTVTITNTTNCNKRNNNNNNNNNVDNVQAHHDINNSSSCNTNGHSSTSSNSNDFNDLNNSRGSLKRSAGAAPGTSSIYAGPAAPDCRGAAALSSNPVTRRHEIEDDAAPRRRQQQQQLEKCMSSISNGPWADHHPHHHSFKRARYESSGMQYFTSGESMWSSNLHYPGPMSLMSNPEEAAANHPNLLPSSFTDHTLINSSNNSIFSSSMNCSSAAAATATDHQLLSPAAAATTKSSCSAHDQLFSTKHYNSSSIMQIMFNSDEPFDELGSSQCHHDQQICRSSMQPPAAAGCIHYDDSSGSGILTSSNFSDLQHQIQLTSYIINSS